MVRVRVRVRVRVGVRVRVRMRARVRVRSRVRVRVRVSAWVRVRVRVRVRKGRGGVPQTRQPARTQIWTPGASLRLRTAVSSVALVKPHSLSVRASQFLAPEKIPFQSKGDGQ